MLELGGDGERVEGGSGGGGVKRQKIRKEIPVRFQTLIMGDDVTLL